MKRLLDIDPLTGTKTYFEHDPKTNQNIIEHVQDVEPIIERNKHLAEGLNKKEDWWYIGSIPDTLILQWATECGYKPHTRGWQNYAIKQMNKSEYSKLNPNRIKL